MNAYLILDLTIHNFDKFQEYINRIPEFISRHSGKYLIKGEVPTVLEGNWNPERVVVIEFPSREHVTQFFEDPDAQSLFQIRHNTTTSRLILVDGCL